MRLPLLFFTTAALLSTSLLRAQTPQLTPTAAFARARSLYYTPVDAGLQGFHCDVAFDWKSFIQKSTNQPVPETDERLNYLRSIKLSVDDDLRGAGALHWTAPTPAPDASEASITQIRTGFEGMWSGFFQTWNGFASGELLSVSDNTRIERTAEGFHLSARTGANLAEEQFNNDLLLQTLHVATPTLDSTTTPTFVDTPHGRVVTVLHSLYRQPPTAPGTEIKMTVSYVPVNTFQLPSELIIEVVGTAIFDFHLANCTVRTQLTPSKPTAVTPH